MTAGFGPDPCWSGISPGTGRGVTLLHGRGPPGFPQLDWSLKALRCLQSAFGAGLYTSASQPPALYLFQC
jgi:hypothetical protein